MSVYHINIRKRQSICPLRQLSDVKSIQLIGSFLNAPFNFLSLRLWRYAFVLFKKMPILAILFIMVTQEMANAEPLTHNSAPIANQWPSIHAAFYNQTPVEDAEEAIRLEAPLNAENPAIVPFAWNVELKDEAIAEMSIFSDGNPILHTVTFQLAYQTNRFSGNTRIRLDQNSIVRVIVRTTKNRYLMKTITVKTPGGGCGGAAMTNESELRASAGRMKIKWLSIPENKSSNLSLHVKHPMRTGFERTYQGYYSKAWFMSNMQLEANGLPLMEILMQPGLSADPYFSLSLELESITTVKVRMKDNEEKDFVSSWP